MLQLINRIIFILIVLFVLPIIVETRISILNVVIDNNYPPYSFLNDNNTLVGYSIDMWKLFEDKNGIKVNITGQNWNIAQKQMIEGRYDVIDTVFKNSQREAIYDFTQPYEKVDTHVFYHKNITGIKDINDLRGFQIATKKGGATVTFLKQNNIKNIKELDSDEDIILSAKNLDTTIFVMGKNTGYYLLYKYGIQNEFKMLSEPLFSNYLHRAVLKGHKELLSTLNNGFIKITRKETEELREKWFGQGKLIAKSYTILLYAVVVILGISLILLAISFYLKKAVDKKTSELEVEKEKFTTLFNNSGHFMGLLDNNGNIILANEMVYDTFKMDKGELIGLPVYELPLFKESREIEEKIKKGLEIARDGKQTKSQFNIIDKGTGAPLYFDIAFTPVKKYGKTMYIIAEGKDITSLIEMTKITEQLKASKNLDIVVSGLAHDFNNLLAGINNYLTVMTEVNKDKDIALMLQNTSNAYKRATNLVKQLLSFSKGIEIKKEDTNICNLVNEVAGFIVSGYKDIKINTLLDKENYIIKADPYLLAQVFENIIINAIQAMDKKGNIVISYSLHSNNGKKYVQISITDEGCGIPEEELNMIFQPLYTRKQRGNGLGLYMAKLIIEKHEGYITVSSSVGKGTTFNIFLPM